MPDAKLQHSASPLLRAVTFCVRDELKSPCSHSMNMLDWLCRSADYSSKSESSLDTCRWTSVPWHIPTHGPLFVARAASDHFAAEVLVRPHPPRGGILRQTGREAKKHLLLRWSLSTTMASAGRMLTAASVFWGILTLCGGTCA